MAEQLDFFKPVQLGLGIEATSPRHLTDLEVEALAQVIERKAGNAVIDALSLVVLYKLDNDTTQRLRKQIERNRQ